MSLSFKNTITKSKGQKDKLDRFYTSEDIAKYCLSLLQLKDFDCVIEPSAGSGSFSKLIDGCFAYDIDPKDTSIKKQDWFLLDKDIFKGYNNILVVGNPPFGEYNKLAIDFFNESAKFANCIAFILPMSFHKNSVKRRLNKKFHLMLEINLENCEFMICGEEATKVSCVFQIWVKKTYDREDVINKKNNSIYFEFVKKENADFSIRRVGALYGKCSFNKDVSNASNYFIKNNSGISNDVFLDIVNSISYTDAIYAVGPKSLTKWELIEKIDKNIEKFLQIKK